MDSFFKKACVNPLEKENHPTTMNSINCPQSFREMFPNILIGAKICLKCKLEIYKLETNNSDDSSSSGAKKVNLKQTPVMMSIIKQALQFLIN